MPEAVTAALAALLRPGAASPPTGQWPVLLDAARNNGVLPLLAAAAAQAGWDRDLIAAMRPDVAAQTVLAVVHERELKRVLDGLAADGVAPLLLKGAHLAFTLYRSPELRPRVDTDLLVRDDDRCRAGASLERLGYAPVPHVTGEVAFGQRQYGRVDDSGARHTVDVHWRIANPKAFADRFTYADLAAGAVRIPRLGAAALAPDPVHALLVACLHRTAHHRSTNRLLWLYDVHLLASALTDTGWRRTIDLAAARGLAPVVAAALSDAEDLLGTTLPAGTLARLNEQAAGTDADVMAYLKGDMSQLQAAASDWRRLGGLRERARFLREHLFPSAAYIRHRYGVSSRLALPLLYTHRIVTGARKWF
jgi:hypothetical protein